MFLYKEEIGKSQKIFDRLSQQIKGWARFQAQQETGMKSVTYSLDLVTQIRKYDPL